MALTPSDGFPYYIQLVGNNDYKSVLSSLTVFDFLSKVSEESSNKSYAPGKWTVKQVVGHMTDHERIMIYRALRFSRNDATVLSGYDQDVLMQGAFFNEIPFEKLLDDFRFVRSCTLSFIDMLRPEQLQRTGTAWKFEISVEDILKATAGHELHHIAVLKERYGL